MALAVIAFSICAALCFVMAAFPEWFGQLGVRMIAAAPGPVRRFYSVANLGRPLDGPFWNRYRRVGGLIMGLLFLALVAKIAIPT
jgi:hypothetical protein